MDAIDEKIIDALRKNSRRSFVAVAKQLGVTEGTVRNRVRMLLKSKAIEFTLRSTSAAEALVFIKAQRTDLKGIGRELEKIASDVYEISGDYDLVAWLEANSTRELNKKVDAVRAVRGVSATSTAIKLSHA